MIQAHAAPYRGRDFKHPRHLIVILAILALMLAACGGGASDTDDSQDGDDNAAVEGVDKGTITYGQAVEDTLATDAAHHYQFTGASGDVLLIRINATGSTFYAPYVFLNGADNTLLVGSDTSRPTRSSRLNFTLTADGIYTLVVQPPADTVPGGYELTIEKVE